MPVVDIGMQIQALRSGAVSNVKVNMDRVSSMKRTDLRDDWHGCVL